MAGLRSAAPCADTAIILLRDILMAGACLPSDTTFVFKGVLQAVADYCVACPVVCLAAIEILSCCQDDRPMACMQVSRDTLALNRLLYIVGTHITDGDVTAATVNALLQTIAHGDPAAVAKELRKAFAEMPSTVYTRGFWLLLRSKCIEAGRKHAK